MSLNSSSNCRQPVTRNKTFTTVKSHKPVIVSRSRGIVYLTIWLDLLLSVALTIGFLNLVSQNNWSGRRCPISKGFLHVASQVDHLVGCTAAPGCAALWRWHSSGSPADLNAAYNLEMLTLLLSVAGVTTVVWECRTKCSGGTYRCVAWNRLMNNMIRQSGLLCGQWQLSTVVSHSCICPQ
jgi:hypothetical protein